MDLENYIMKMVDPMKVIGNMEKLKDMESFIINLVN
jgi:hypothetical protein